MADYSISLGALISPEGLQRVKSQIETIEANPIKLQIDSSLVDSRIKGIKQELTNLGGKGGLKFDTKTLEASLDRVSADIKEIRTAFGTLDSKSGMNNLLTSINQISVALDNASKQFVELNAQLNSLAGKNFSINFGINMGSGNAVSRNAAYGSMVRGETIPQLQQQVTALENYLQQYYKVADGFNAVQKLIQGTNIVTGLNHPMTLLPKMADGSNLSQQMTAYKQYIALIREAASMKGVDLSSVTSGFSKSANELISDAQKVQTGAAEMENSFEKLKQIFGGGNNFNVEGISAQLDSIVADLNEIKVAIQSLSSGNSLDGLTQNFKELSLALKELTSNFTLVRSNLTSGLSGAGSGVTNVAQNIKEADIKVDDMKGSVESLKTALQGLGFNSASIDTITKDFQELGISVKNVTTQLRSDGNVVLSIKGLDQYERVVTLMRSVGKDGSLTNLGTSISQSFKETEVAFNRLKAIAGEMKSLKVNIAGLDPQKDSAKIEILTSQLNRLQTEYRELYGITGQNLSNTQLDVLKQNFIETANAVQRAKAAMADTSAIQRQTQAFKELAVVSKEIGNLEIGIAKLRVQGGNAAQIEILEQQLRELQATYQHLVTTMNTPLTDAQWSSIYTQIFQTQDKLAQLDAKFADTKAKLASGINANFGNYDNQLLSLENRISGLANKAPQLQSGLEGVRQALATLKSADGTDALIAAHERYLAILKQVEIQVRQVELAERGSNDAIALQQQKQQLALKMSNWLRDNSAAAKQFGGEIRDLQVQLNNCGNTAGVQQVGRQFDIVTAKAKEAGLTALTFGDRIKKQFAQYSSYISVYSLFMYATMAMRSMFEQVKAIDSAMTELKKVTDESASSYNKFLSNAATRSKEIGTTIDGLVSSTADFARLGYGFKDAQGLAEVANIYAVVGDEIEGVEQATESLISTMAAFKEQQKDISNEDFAMDVIDKFNEIGNNFAISSGGSGEALTRSASSLAAANNTLDESIALITAANTVVVLCHAA